MSSRSELIHALSALIRAIDYAEDITTVRSGAMLQHAKTVVGSALNGSIKPLPWTPFTLRRHIPLSERQILSAADKLCLSVEAVREQARMILTEENLYVNSRYQVTKRETGEQSCHLSIKRIDQSVVHDWRDLQRIKDELVGSECEAIELYPAQSRLVDTSNQYHLWCSCDPAFRFPVGFSDNLVAYGSGSHNQRDQEI